MTPTTVEIARRTLSTLAPEIFLLLCATAMMTAGVFVQTPRRVWSAISLLVLSVTAVLLLVVGIDEPGRLSLALPVLNDAFSVYVRAMVLLSGFLLLALAHDQVEESKAPEFFGSLLFILAGAMVVGASNELVLLFVGLELVSIPTYVLLYLPRRQSSLEATTKYFFLSILSSGLLLFGLAYLYGVSGLTNLHAISELASRVPGLPSPGLLRIASVFIVAGLGFRVAAVPFHFYAPDVYQGSPAFTGSLLSWLPKVIGFVAFLKTITPLVAASGVSDASRTQVLMLTGVVAVATMTLGNTVALAQNDLKRLLAYSSIAHAGYLMIGVCVALCPNGGQEPVYYATESILLYLAAYGLMTLGAFGVIILLNQSDRRVEAVDDLGGLSQTQPLWALALSFCLFSLAGIPPFAGFLGKFELFSSALFAVGPGRELLWWIAILGVLNSAAGAYYYLRIIVTMYLLPPKGEAASVRVAWPTATAVLCCAVLSLLLGLFPSLLVQSTHKAALVTSKSVFTRTDTLPSPSPTAFADLNP